MSRIIKITPDSISVLLNIRAEVDGDGHKTNRIRKNIGKYSYENTNRAAFVYMYGNKGVGYVEVNLVETDFPEGAPELPELARSAHLVRIGVDCAYREQGIAKRLLTHAEAWIRSSGHENVWLDYLQQNRPAGKLYSSYQTLATFRDIKGKIRILAFKKLS